MFKKNEIAHLYIGMSGGFYVGIVILMLNVGIKTGFIANVLVISGLLASCIPDILINLDIADIDIKRHRRDLIGKILAFMAVYFYLRECKYILFLLCILFLCIINVIDVFFVWKQMKSSFITKRKLIEKLKNVEEKIDTDKLSGYLAGILINNALFVNMQDSIPEIVIWGVIYLGVHLYLSENIIKVMKKNNRKISKNKYRFILWSIHIITMIVCIMKFDMICYVFGGVYCVVVIDITMQNKTAIIKEK